MMRNLVVIAAVLLSGSAMAQDDTASGIMCSPSGKNSMQCQVKNGGPKTIEICADVVKVCKRGDHVATMCSGELAPGETRSKVVAAFQPKVGIFEACMGGEIRNRQVRIVD